MRGGVLLIVVAGCGFSPFGAGAHDDAPGNGSDAVLGDAAFDAPPGQMCFGSFAYDRICYLDAQVPTGSRMFVLAEQLDTDGTMCDATAILPPDNPCVIAAGSITFTSTAAVRVTGARPLVLVATEAGGIAIAAGALLDASSVFTQIGAGSIPAEKCTGATEATAKSGGYGGSFVALGGEGGDGAGDTGHGIPATPFQAPLTELHGGCPGGAGGGNNTTLAPGGGAIALVAQTIAIDGLVAAGGAGGHAPGNNNHGGNGGGAGGMIVVDSTALLGAGELDAKGGGGGEGTGGLVGIDGTAGYNFVNRAAESVGGSGDSTGGDGGHGGPQIDLTLAGAGGGPGVSAAGGGGGGGAAGVIRVTAANVPALVFEPAPQ